ncbi:MAG: hypothetical protein IIC33_07260 [Chloroflexi bacterium]|nr:hypothetical protein [Chloroflexota bacterium]
MGSRGEITPCPEFYSLGAKQVSIWLGPDSVTIERKGNRSAKLTLSDTQLGELTEVMCRIE